MSEPRALLPDAAAEFLAAHPDTLWVDAILADLSGVVRGKRYPVEQLGKLLGRGFTLPSSVFLLDTMGRSHDPAGHGFSDGDPDSLARVVPGSLKPVPWSERPSCQVLVTLVDEQERPYFFEPRNVLRRVVERFDKLSLRPVVAFELEFYLIDPERGENGAPQPPINPLSGRRDSGTQVYGMVDVEAYADVLEAIHKACAAQDIPCGAISAEYAPGQFEVNLEHVPDPLLAADHCVLFKRAVQGVVRRFGLRATFMAKPYVEQAGSGLHLHISMLDKQGHNVFDGGYALSPQLGCAIAGVLETLPEAMAFLAPNVNSYRRFMPNIFVPIRRSWGHENRSAALRIPLGDGSAKRIEHRVAGADANPYLALATALAGIHYGISESLEPPPMTEGNAGFAYDKALPFRPRRALDRLRRAKILSDYFGAEYLRAYAACKDAEMDAFEDDIGSREYAWYLQPE